MAALSIRLGALLGSLATPILLPAQVPQPARAIQIKPGAKPPAAQEARVALVIGNGAYRESPLKNPVNDAKAMAAALRACGFRVDLVLDADRNRMFQAVREFGQKIQGGGVGLFYFAGHGMAVKGANYLIPVAADIAGEDEVEIQALSVQSVLNKMEGAKNRLNLLVLDACRNNPFARSFRSAASGLAQMDAPTGTFIAYATAPGSTAADGTGANGLYTQHLLQALGRPGLKVEEVFKQVRIEVKQASGDKQVPWDSSSLTGDFYFRAGPAAGTGPAALAAAPSPAEELFRKGLASASGQGAARSDQEALSWFIQAADLGHPGAQGRLGRMYAYGLGTPINRVQALAYFRKAAEQDDPAGQFGLAAAYAGHLPGCGLAPDQSLAIQWLTRSADQGYPYALANLGGAYNTGSGVDQDQGRALNLFRKAMAAAQPLADQGDPGAQNLLGYVLRMDGPLRDEAAARTWIRKSADQGFVLAQLNLGSIYRHGQGVPKDLAQSALWFRKAGDQGDPEGQYQYGSACANGLGVPVDQAEAVAWFRKAAGQGYAHGESGLGYCYLYGHGVSQDTAQAAAWFRKAADQGLSDGENNLGACYLDGRGLAQDDREAAVWFRKAAEQGQALAECNLGWCYLNGRGLTQDYAQALAWFRKAAEQNEPVSQMNLGHMNEHGLGLSKDLDQARIYYQKAADQGNTQARDALKRLGPKP